MMEKDLNTSLALQNTENEPIPSQKSIATKSMTSSSKKTSSSQQQKSSAKKVPLPSAISGSKTRRAPFGERSNNSENKTPVPFSSDKYADSQVQANESNTQSSSKSNDSISSLSLPKTNSLFDSLPPAPTSSKSSSSILNNKNNPNLTMPVGSCDMFNRLLGIPGNSKQSKRKAPSNGGLSNKRAFGDATNRLGISSSPIRPPKTPPQGKVSPKSQTMGGRIRVQDIRARPGMKRALGSMEGTCSKNLFNGQSRSFGFGATGSALVTAGGGANGESQTSSGRPPIQWGFSNGFNSSFGSGVSLEGPAKENNEQNGVKPSELKVMAQPSTNKVPDLPPGIYSYDLNQKDDRNSYWNLWVRDDDESIDTIQNSETMGLAISKTKKAAWVFKPSDLEIPCLEKLSFSPPLKENDTLIQGVCGNHFVAILTQSGLVYISGYFENADFTQKIQVTTDKNTALLYKKIRFRVETISAAANTLFCVTKKYGTVYWTGYPLIRSSGTEASTTPPDSDNEIPPPPSHNCPDPTQILVSGFQKLVPHSLPISAEGVTMRTGTRVQARIVKMWAGSDRVFFVDAQNRLFAMGNNHRGQCGIETPALLQSPTLISWYTHKLTMPSEAMAFSKDYTVFLDPSTDDLFFKRSVFLMGHDQIHPPQLDIPHSHVLSVDDDDEDARSDTTLTQQPSDENQFFKKEYPYLSEMKPSDYTKMVCCSGDDLLYLNVINEVYRLPTQSYFSTDRYNKALDGMAKTSQPARKKYPLSLLSYKTIWKGEEAHFTLLQPKLIFSTGTHLFCLFHKLRMQKAVMVNGELKVIEVPLDDFHKEPSSLS